MNASLIVSKSNVLHITTPGHGLLYLSSWAARTEGRAERGGGEKERLAWVKSPGERCTFIACNYFAAAEADDVGPHCHRHPSLGGG